MLKKLSKVDVFYLIAFIFAIMFLYLSALFSI